MSYVCLFYEYYVQSFHCFPFILKLSLNKTHQNNMNQHFIYGKLFLENLSFNQWSLKIFNPILVGVSVFLSGLSSLL